MEVPTERQSPVNDRKTPWEKYYKPLPLVDVSGLRLLIRVVALAAAGVMIAAGQVVLNILHFDPVIHFTVQGIMYLSTLVLALLSVSLLLMVSHRFIIRLLFESRVLHDSYVQFLLARKHGAEYKPYKAATPVTARSWSSPRDRVAVADDDDDQEESRQRRRGRARSS